MNDEPERRRNINISREELNDMLREAGREGGQAALREIGLHDDHAGYDLRELRTLLGLYREMRSSVARTLTRAMTYVILGALGFAAVRRFWGGGGS